MCASIENYAKNYAQDVALDEAIIMGIKYCPSKEQLIGDAIEQFPNISKDVIISRVTILWNQKKK